MAHEPRHLVFQAAFALDPCVGLWSPACCPSSSFNCIRFLPFPPLPHPCLSIATPKRISVANTLPASHPSHAPKAPAYQQTRLTPHPRRRCRLLLSSKPTETNTQTNSEAPLSQPSAENNVSLHKTHFPRTPRYLRVYVHRKSQVLRYAPPCLATFLCLERLLVVAA